MLYLEDNKYCTARAHTVVPRSLSPVLGATNPLDQDVAGRILRIVLSLLKLEPGYISGTKTINDTILAGNLIKCIAVVSYDVK